MKIIAHRSGPVDYPEQTVESAKQALELGADYVEIDLRFDKDGDIVVCHDDNALRVFGVDKKICDMTSEEFKSLRHKDNPEYSSHFFIDYINAGIKPLLLHIKEGGENILKILDYISQNNYMENVTLGVSRPYDVEAVKAYNPKIPVLAFIQNADHIDDNIDAGADYIRLWEKYTSDDKIDHIVKRGRKVWIMVGNVERYETGYTSSDFLKYLYSREIDGILINNVTGLNK